MQFIIYANYFMVSTKLPQFNTTHVAIESN